MEDFLRRMNKEAAKKNERRIRTIVILSIVPTLFIIGIVLFSFIRPLFLPRVDPLDVGIDKMRKIAAEAIVVDSANNGFKAIYVTVHGVTPARYDEIVSRRHIRDSLEHLKIEAPRYFGNMLYTDIYDFTRFAHRFHPDPDLILHNVFVFGKEKEALYIGPNPRIENPAKYIDNGTLQGVLYINAEDIRRCVSDTVRVYRYWRCSIPHKQSDSDEHFSHFSEDERLR